MKLNIVLAIIALCISILIAYGFYSFGNDNNKLLLSTGSFIALAVTLIVSISVDFDLPRTNINIKIVSGIFFLILLISNLIFSFCSFTTPTYIVVNGILLLIYLLITYSIHKSKQ